ncbi:MAG: hypothetical protein K6G40_05510, partial [Eubacterium sp.]|nr:hypothetical protein [Eubacterium sp.]
AFVTVTMIYVMSLSIKKEIKIIRMISENSLGIFFIHYILIHIAWKIVPHSPIWRTLLASAFVGVFVIMISLAIVVVLKKVPGVRRIL